MSSETPGLACFLIPVIRYRQSVPVRTLTFSCALRRVSAFRNVGIKTYLSITVARHFEAIINEDYSCPWFRIP
jgi:hypothetical protein